MRRGEVQGNRQGTAPRSSRCLLSPAPRAAGTPSHQRPAGGSRVPRAPRYRRVGPRVRKTAHWPASSLSAATARVVGLRRALWGGVAELPWLDPRASLRSADRPTLSRGASAPGRPPWMSPSSPRPAPPVPFSGSPLRRGPGRLAEPEQVDKGRASSYRWASRATPGGREGSAAVDDHSLG